MGLQTRSSAPPIGDTGRRLVPTSTPSVSTAPLSAFDSFRANGYFTALDGLRGLSILLVLLHHVPPIKGSVWSTLQENGRFGVAFFFVISGFLICSLLLRDERVHGRISLLKFYGRRALRLLPLYYAVLFFQIILVYGLHQYSPENQLLFQQKLPSYLFYYSNWLATATQGPFFFSWSLAVEEQFYLVFGFLLVFLPRRWLLATVIGALLTKFLVYQFVGSVDTWSTPWRIAFSYQEAILWGVLLAFALDRRSTFQLVGFVRSPWVISGAALLAVTWLFFHPMETSSTWDAELLYLLMTLIVANLVLRPPTPWLSRGLFAHVGRISYGVYLLHMFVIQGVKKLPGGTDPAICLVLTLIIVIPLASVVYRYFELPIINYYKRRLAPAAPARKPVPAGVCHDS